MQIRDDNSTRLTVRQIRPFLDVAVVNTVVGVRVVSVSRVVWAVYGLKGDDYLTWAKIWILSRTDSGSLWP